MATFHCAWVLASEDQTSVLCAPFASMNLPTSHHQLPQFTTNNRLTQFDRKMTGRPDTGTARTPSIVSSDTKTTPTGTSVFINRITTKTHNLLLRTLRRLHRNNCRLRSPTRNGAKTDILSLSITLLVKHYQSSPSRPHTQPHNLTPSPSL